MQLYSYVSLTFKSELKFINLQFDILVNRIIAYRYRDFLICKFVQSPKLWQSQAMHDKQKHISSKFVNHRQKHIFQKSKKLHEFIKLEHLELNELEQRSKNKSSKFINLERQLKNAGYKLIAGIDEAGRGPLAGPVVSAAVILKEDAFPPTASEKSNCLHHNSKDPIPGLNDSKKLTAKQRIRLFNLILKNAVDYSITAVSHLVIDKYNILNATRFANDLCISALQNKPDIAVIDGHDSQILDIPFITVVKGDAHVRSIAAASILAKVVRDAIMQRYSKEFPQYSFEKHVGYGTRLHRSCLAKHGFCAIHRKSFCLIKHENRSMWELWGEKPGG